MGEILLVVRTEEIKKHVDFNGFLPLSQEEVDKLYSELNVLDLDRDLAEEDPTFKQFVAYTVVKSGDRYLSYVRGKDLGEARLHGNRSIGIGGHINYDDSANLFLDDHLKVAAFREVDEEVRIEQKYDLHLAGLLNDDSNEVGKVHLGLVYVCELAEPDVKKRERGIAQIKFETADELKGRIEEFETWSQILINNIENI